MNIEKEINPNFRNARFLMIFGALIGILIYFMLFLDKLILISTDARNIDIGGSSYEGLSYFYYILYGFLLVAFILILVSQIYLYTFLKPKTKIVGIISILFIGLFVLSMVLYLIPSEYINIFLFGPDNSNQGFIEVGALLTIGNYINKMAGDHTVHILIFRLTLVLALISFYLINLTYNKVRETIGLIKNRFYISPILLILSWIYQSIIIGNGHSIFYGHSSTERTLMICYFLYLTSEAIFYLSYMSIFIELFVRFYKLKSSPTSPLIVDQKIYTNNSLYN